MGLGSWGPDGLADSDCGLWTPGALGYAFAGTSVDPNVSPNNSFASINLWNEGADTLSFGIWIKHILVGAYTGQTVECFSGCVDSSTRVARAGLRFTTAGTVVARVSDGSTTVESGALTPTLGWHFWTMVEESANSVVVRRDGVSLATLDITSVDRTSADDLLTPLSGMDTSAPTAFDKLVSADPGSSWPDSLTDPFTDFAFSHYPVIVGPMCVGGDFTTAEIDACIQDRTIVPYDEILDWWKWEGLTGVVSWEDTLRHIIRGVSDYAMENCAAPRAETSVTVKAQITPTESTTVFEFGTLESYGQNIPASPYAFEDGMRAQVAFVRDAFPYRWGWPQPGY